MDGKEVIGRVRAWSQVPIVVRSARDREAEKIAALDLGADDFVTKPFGTGELMARLRAALRHRLHQVGEMAAVRIGEIEIDILRRRVTRNDVEVRLSPREFNILALFDSARRTGCHSHAGSERGLGGASHKANTQYLRVYVGHFRQKLEQNQAEPRIVFTDPGIGYRVAESRSVEPASA